MFKTFPIFAILLSLINFPLIAAPLSADQVVAAADEVRNPQLDYKIHVNVSHVSIHPQKGEQKSTAAYEVWVKGKKKSLVKTLAPARDRNRCLLMLDKNLWAILPNISKPVRVSLQQRLIGEVANGDLARANFAGDYNATILETTKDHIVLELIAKTNDMTYHKVKYWVGRKNNHPVKAEFFAVSGRLLKTCLYQDYRMFGGRIRPTTWIMSNPLTKGQKTIVQYRRVEIKPLADKIFRKEYLQKLGS